MSSYIKRTRKYFALQVKTKMRDTSIQYFNLMASSVRLLFFFFSSRRRHTRCSRDWSSDVCSSDLVHLAHFQHARECVDIPHIVVHDQDGLAGKRRLLLGGAFQHFAERRGEHRNGTMQKQGNRLDDMLRRGCILDNNGTGEQGKTRFLFRRKVLPGVNNDR